MSQPIYPPPAVDKQGRERHPILDATGVPLQRGVTYILLVRVLGRADMSPLAAPDWAECEVVDAHGNPRRVDGHGFSFIVGPGVLYRKGPAK